MTTPTNPAAVVEQVDTDLGMKLWATHPRDVPEGMTRAQYYAQEIARHRLLGIEQGRAEMRDEADALRDIITECAADLSTEEPFWTAGMLADRLIAKGIRSIPTAKDRPDAG